MEPKKWMHSRPCGCLLSFLFVYFFVFCSCCAVTTVEGRWRKDRANIVVVIRMRDLVRFLPLGAGKFHILVEFDWLEGVYIL